ncbi:MAG: restriction endonuclease FokI C-terminal domain-containing protein [Gammaproteobacteria bacterium]
MVERTFGWVQDPEDLQKLRRAVDVFCPGSAVHAEVCGTVAKLIATKDNRTGLLQAMARRPLRLSYRELVGSSFKPRYTARCNGIMQAAIKGQKRPFIGDWPADNFVRWAHALGFVEWCGADDCFQITAAGKSLSRTKAGSEREYEVFAHGLLSYPPAVRVIGLLADAAQTKAGGMTKFEIGRRLGFQGEMGFTTISQNFYIKEYSLAQSADERSKMRANWEGSADKYARMICSWLSRLKHPWVRAEKHELTGETGGEKHVCELRVYALTAKGFEERKKITGASSSRRIAKRLPAEMLCTKGPGRMLLRARRARVAAVILKHSATAGDIAAILQKEGIAASPGAVESDLRGLENIGLVIDKTDGAYRCRDKITGLDIPQKPAAHSASDDIRRMKEQCEEALRFVPHDFLALIQMAFNGQDNRMFEIKIAELLTEYCRFHGRHLGGANQPDAVISDGEVGAVIDAKSYSKGFNIPAPERDKMSRYLTDIKTRPESNKTLWWLHFPGTVRRFLFLFVSGKFGGNFRKQLKTLGTHADTKGGAVTAMSLLLFAEQIASGKMQRAEFLRRISILDEAKPDDAERH